MLRTSRTEVRALRATRKRTRITENGRERMRNHFVARLREDKSAEDGQATTRSAEVRGALNSPFWPFVLATKGFGQSAAAQHA